MDCLIEERGDVVVVSPQGSLDAQTTDEFLGAGTKYFVTDFGAATIVDSAGLGALVRLYKRVRIEEGDVCLARVPPSVRKDPELTRLSRVSEVYSTVEEAATSIKGRD